MKTKTKIQIVNETVKYYSEDPSRRSVYKAGSGQICAYRGPGRKRCAFSRCCRLVSCLTEGDGAYQLLSRLGETILKPEYRGHSPHFWDALQGLHDDPSCWSDKGLTSGGRARVRELKQKIKAGSYRF